MKYKKIVFSNGLRLMLVPMKDNATVTMMILVEAGSRYEDKKNNGISHFLGHMCFKGTEKRDYKEIAFSLDSIGAQFNAFTSEDYTGYYAKTHYSNFFKISNILNDIYLNSNIPEAELEKERGVIIEEINMYEDLPQRKIYDVFIKLLYGEAPLGQSIAGPKENIKAFTRKDFLNYREKHYSASATTIVVAGNFDEKSVKKEIEKYFNSLPKKPLTQPSKIVEKQKEPAIKLEYKKTDQSHLYLGFRTFDTYDQRQTTLAILATILGKGMSSRLFSKMRDELGICYYVQTDLSATSDSGFFVVKSGVGNARLEEATSAILKEIQKIKIEEVSSKELAKAQKIMISKMFLNLETSDSQAEFYGAQEIFHEKIKTPQEIIKEIKAVTPQKIKKLAQEIFVNKNLNLAVIGPTKDPKKLKKILKI